MKKSFSFLLIVLFFVSLVGCSIPSRIGMRDTSLSSVQNTSEIFGDVNRDSAVNSTDARWVLQYCSDTIGDNELNLSMADVNGDVTVNTTDARIILQYCAEILTQWPCASITTTTSTTAKVPTTTTTTWKEPTADEACRVVVGGNELPESCYARLNRAKEYAEIPLLAVFSALGGKIEPLDNHTVQIVIREITYVLDAQNGILTDESGCYNFLDMDVWDHERIWRTVGDECITDTHYLEIVFLYHLRITTVIDYENAVVYIDWMPTYEPEVYDDYRLIINGQEHPAGEYVRVIRHEYGYYYDVIPLIAISEALGAEIERQSDEMIVIKVGGVEYQLNSKEGTLFEKGQNMKYITPAPGSNHFVFYSKEDEFMVDSSSISLFTFHVLNVRVIMDRESKTITVVDRQTV